MLNSHCNNDKKNIKKKTKKKKKKNRNMRPAGREPTIHRLKDHRATRYATEIGAKVDKYICYMLKL